MRVSDRSYLAKVDRSPNWYYLRDVPKALRSTIGKRRWKVSLGTADRRVALSKAAELTVRFDTEIRKAERQIAPQRVITEAEARVASLPAHEREMIRDAGGVAGYVDWLKAQEAEAKHDRAKADALTSLAFPAANENADDTSSHLSRTSASILTIALAEDQADIPNTMANITGLEARASVISSNVAQGAAILAKVGIDAEGATKARAPETLSDLVQEWKVATKPGAPAQFEYAVKIFDEILGSPKLADITKADVRRFRDALLEMPAATPRVRGLTAPQAIAFAKAEGHPLLASSTAKKHFRCIGTIFRFGISDGFIDDNPTSDLQMRTAKRSFAESQDSKRRSMSPAELRLVLAKAEECWKREPEAIWFLRTLVYTGARPEELAQLTSGDVQKIGTVNVISIHDREGQRVKTASSVRYVPIHPALVDAGFLDFVARRANASTLFGFTDRGNGRLYTAMGAKLMRLIRNQAKITDKRVVAYSIRHAFKDAGRLAEVPEDIRDAIQGHSDPSRKVSRGYGDIRQLVVTLDKWMKKIDPFDPKREVSIFGGDE